jgi:Transposase DDE domain
MNPPKVNKQKYCQYVVNDSKKYTCSNLSNSLDCVSGDAVERLLSRSDFKPRTVWNLVKNDLIQHSSSYIIFDDSVLDKDRSRKISGTLKQYSGNTHGLVVGIGVVNMIYVNPQTMEYTIIDYRIYNPEVDGKDKLQHVIEMIDCAIARRIEFECILVDTWYAKAPIFMHIQSVFKKFVCPIQTNRLVQQNLTDPQPRSHKRVDELTWSQQELKYGKTVTLKGMSIKVQLFKIISIKGEIESIEYIVTNYINSTSYNYDSDLIKQIIQIRWKVEQYHREVKQTTGIEKCQCRKYRSQKNHINCCITALIFLKKQAKKLNQTIYQIKDTPYQKYLRLEMQNPTFVFDLC